MTYEEQLAKQQRDLAVWQTRLRPEVFAPVRAYVLAVNRRETATTKALVYHGYNLVHIIQEWPTLSPWFEPVPVKEEEACI